MTPSHQDSTQSNWTFPTFTKPVPVTMPETAWQPPCPTSSYVNEFATPAILPTTQELPIPVGRLPTTTVWGLPFAQATMEQTVNLADRIVQTRLPEYFITANLNYLMLTSELPELTEVNQACCTILADGNPIVWRSRLEPQPLPCRVAGSDLIIQLAKLAADKGYRIYFLGGANGVAEAAAEKLKSMFANLQVAGCYAPPFRQLSDEEHHSMIQGINQAKTDILLVAFGQPKGELWIYDHLDELHVPLSIQLGASFDFLAGTAQRAPEFWQRLGCEWLYRAACDPQRLAPRYAKNILFLLGLCSTEFFTIAKNLLAPRLVRWISKLKPK